MARGMKKQRKKRARRRRKARERLWWLLDYQRCGDDLVDATRFAIRAMQGVGGGARRTSKSLRRFMETAGGVNFGWHHWATLDHMEELMAYPPPVPSPRPWKPSPFQRVRIDDDGAHDHDALRQRKRDEVIRALLAPPCIRKRSEGHYCFTHFPAKGDDDGNE